MREVKFRAWDKVNEMWLKITGFETHVLDDGKTASINKGLGGMFHDGDYIGTFQKHAGEQNNVTLIQYTGLKDDVNDREIYEGDIMRAYNRLWEQHVTLKVHYLNGCFMFGNYNAHGFFKEHQNIEVIGNIFENPELLEGK